MRSIAFITLLLISSLNCSIAQQKIAITKAEDLPKHSYILKHNDAVALVQDEEKIIELAIQVKYDLIADLEKYDIRENASLREYYQDLWTISILEHNYEKAMEYILKARTLASKKSDKIMIGLEPEVVINAIAQNYSRENEILNSQIAKSLEQKLQVDDFSIIQEDVEYEKGNTEIYSKNFLLGMVKSENQPALENNSGEIPKKIILDLIYMHYYLNYYVPYRTAFNTAYSNILSKRATIMEKRGIWKDREIELHENSNYTPVLVAVWDSGVDMAVFPESKRWVNIHEQIDGKDNDRNGFVDDVHGIAYDLEKFKDSSALLPLPNNLKNIQFYQNLLKGLNDLSANINSAAASNLKNYLSQIAPEAVEEFWFNLNFYNNYSHGTHVAGIVVSGNEMIKIMYIRNTYDHTSIPLPLNNEIVERRAKSYGEIVNYLKKHNVRVVNISWGYTYEYVVSSLEKNGIGADDNERKIMAKTYFTKLYNAFKSAIVSAPEILFVCSSGNSNDDVDFTSDYPSSINLPNLITVGAVDIEGKKTSFTTEGSSVDVYANGYEVESYVPGGDRMALSGTSMSAPFVSNLAAKILAINPSLKPAEVINIIKKTSTISSEDEKVFLIHPKKAIELTLD